MNLLEVGIPTVPLRGMVVYPNIVIHLDIGRDKSIKAVEAAMNEDRIMAVVSQKDDSVDAPTVHDLAQMGTLVKIKQMLRLPGGIVRVLVEGITRIRVMNITSMDPYYVGDYERVASIFEDDVELEAYRRLVQSKFNEWADEAKTITEEGVTRVMELRDPCELADQVAFMLPVNNAKRQELLEELSLRYFNFFTCRHIQREISIQIGNRSCSCSHNLYSLSLIHISQFYFVPISNLLI